jgi:uncharacterized phage protein (TIGR01671 family)
MRDIKFRGQTLDCKSFVYGDLIQLNDGRKYIIDNNFGACIDDKGNFVNTESPFVCEVIPGTVAQYTEQNDINGNEIYEGMTVSQVAVLVGSPDIDYMGLVKFYDGSWWIDDGYDAISLFNEACENTIERDY